MKIVRQFTIRLQRWKVLGWQLANQAIPHQTRGLLFHPRLAFRLLLKRLHLDCLLSTCLSFKLPSLGFVSFASSLSSIPKHNGGQKIRWCCCYVGHGLPIGRHRNFFLRYHYLPLSRTKEYEHCLFLNLNLYHWHFVRWTLASPHCANIGMWQKSFVATVLEDFWHNTCHQVRSGINARSKSCSRTPMSVFIDSRSTVH